MIVYNKKLLNEKNLKETSVISDNEGIPEYPVDKNSGVGVQSIEKKQIASGYPVPEYNTSVCEDINKKTEKLQEVHYTVNASTGLKSASSGQQKQSFNSLVQSGNPVLKHSIEDLLKNGKEGDKFLTKKHISLAASLITLCGHFSLTTSLEYKIL